MFLVFDLPQKKLNVMMSELLHLIPSDDVRNLPFHKVEFLCMMYDRVNPKTHCPIDTKGGGEVMELFVAEFASF